MQTLQMKELRLERGWTQKEVAEKIGVTKSTVNLLESGLRKPSYEVLVKLEALFGVTHNVLFRRH